MAIILPPDDKKRRKKEKKGQPVRPSKAVETSYFRAFVQRINQMMAVGSIVNARIQAGESMSSVMNFLKYQQLIIFPELQMDDLARVVVGRANQAQKKRFESIISKAIGVDVLAVIDSEKIDQYVNIAVQNNVGLIKTVKGKYFDQIQEAVYNNFIGVAQPEGRTLLKQIQHIGKVSKNSAKLIARDQAQKLNSNFNQIRQEDAGISRYIWRTSKDRRVVGTPGGLYPKGSKKHGNHYRREGKKYRWDNPPHDGHPGQPIQCRCTAEPIINIDEIQEKSKSAFR